MELLNLLEMEQQSVEPGLEDRAQQAVLARFRLVGQRRKDNLAQQSKHSKSLASEAGWEGLDEPLASSRRSVGGAGRREQHRVLDVPVPG